MASGGVIVLGSINVDLVVKTGRLPEPGETVLGGEFYRSAGGKGANQAVAAARSGRAPVRFIAAVGGDALGRELMEQLQQERLDLSSVKVVTGEPTGVALITVDASGENAIAVASGANAHLLPDDVRSVPDEVFRGATTLLASLETPWETVVTALHRAKAFGLTTILNPAPADMRLMDRSILSLVDVLTPNANEAAMLAGVSSSSDRLQDAAATFHQFGVGCVVFTMGASGVVVSDRPALALQPLQAFRVEAVDTTAAGDAFNGALAAAFCDGAGLVEACRWAMAAAALSVTRKGAQPSLATRREIEQFLFHEA